MGLLLDLLADEFPDIARERDRVRRDAALTAAVQNATTVVDTARALVTVYDDGSRTVHPSAALTVPALLDEIDRLTAERNRARRTRNRYQDERNNERQRVSALRLAYQTAKEGTEGPPTRDDQVAAWLKAHRDAADDWTPTKATIGNLLDEYRLHADTGTPLDQHACETRCCEECATGGTR